MKLTDIYKKCKCWIFEKGSSTIYDSYVIEIANQILAETYEENNMCRMFNNLLPLTEIPQVTEETGGLDTDFDTLGIMPEYQLDVIPKGIDSCFLMDDDLNKMSILQTQYNNARVMHQKMVSQDKVDELTEEANAS